VQVSSALAGAFKGGEREQLRSQVFRPSHALPDYTIEEAGEYELNVMQTIEDANKAAIAESGIKPKDPDESDDEEAEMKARNWDDWKDENPRGQGNRTLKPLR
jgi:immunoglobulin-binding protein 1